MTLEPGWKDQYIITKRFVDRKKRPQKSGPVRRLFCLKANHTQSNEAIAHASLRLVLDMSNFLQLTIRRQRLGSRTLLALSRADLACWAARLGIQ